MAKSKAKSKAKSVKLSVTHDRLTLTAQYATGGSFRFTLGRSGESLTWGGASSDPATNRLEMERFLINAQLESGETNQGRMERLKKLAESVNSMKELAAAI
jgi:hypothetical protein